MVNERIVKKKKKHEVVAFRKNNDTMALQWRDKRVVTMLSSVYNTQCEDEERILGNQQSTTVAKPVVIFQYTKYIGGVDKADQYPVKKNLPGPSKANTRQSNAVCLEPSLIQHLPDNCQAFLQGKCREMKQAK